MKRLYLFVVALLLLYIPTEVYAGWPIGKYRHVFTPSFMLYSSKNYWDKQGNKIIAPSGTNFTAVSLGLYGGIGLGRRTDLYVSLPISVQHSTYAGEKQSTPSGLGDLSIGLSYNLAQFSYKRFLSVQGTGIIPLYTVAKTNNTLGYGVLGGDIKLMYCGVLAGPSYFNLEGGFRRYLDAKGPNQGIFLASIGSALDARKKNQLSLDVSGIYSFSSNRDLISVNPNLVYDGYYIKGSINYGYKFTNKLSVFAGGFYNIIGRNAPVGYGGALSVIFKY
ncbi:hypothetical protein HH214_03680 [Mucilaginibacter robiniae]|uniref:Uncharacterized protein n=1 Tax=Mucilaginibacter robiniae TaxID=2728022 RepID=A0A7L5E2M0_9SPHI|nr:hypothetical protein [Mucilaginibacter robiniae]QJD95043.1 hypothetical protein HH214_03680 [Mucilaginibacter robiniae]